MISNALKIKHDKYSMIRTIISLFWKDSYFLLHQVVFVIGTILEKYGLHDILFCSTDRNICTFESASNFNNGKKVSEIETYYLIDYENVHGDGLSGCQDLGKTDHIVIFFTQNAKNIDMRDISRHGEADLEMIEVPAGKQSTDMHIGSYLGYLAGKLGSKCTVVIVSNDTDFDKVIDFWEEKIGIAVSRSQQIKKKTTTKSQPKKLQISSTSKNTIRVSSAKKTMLNQEVMKTVINAGFDASVANSVAQIATGLYGDEHMLSEVHNELKEKYTNYLEVYAAVKTVISKYADEDKTKTSAEPVTAKDKTTKNSEIQKTLSKAGLSSDIVNDVSSTAVKNLTQKNGKQQTYRAVISKYGQTKGLNIYNHIKKLI